jgi:hypothetical protein
MLSQACHHPKNALDLLENLGQIRNVEVQCILGADLMRNAIVAKTSIRRAGNATAEGAVGKLLESVPCITDDDAGAATPILQRRSGTTRG